MVRICSVLFLRFGEVFGRKPTLFKYSSIKSGPICQGVSLSEFMAGRHRPQAKRHDSRLGQGKLITPPGTDRSSEWSGVGPCNITVKKLTEKFSQLLFNDRITWQFAQSLIQSFLY